MQVVEYHVEIYLAGLHYLMMTECDQLPRELRGPVHCTMARAAGVPTPGGGASTLGLLGDRTRSLRCFPRQLHNFLSGFPQVISHVELQTGLREQFPPLRRVCAL